MQTFARIVQQIGHDVTKEFLAPHKVRLTLPGGFPYEAFDATARIRPWYILSMVELGRALSFNPLPHQPSQGFLDFHQLYKDYFQFIVSAKLDVSPAMYDIAVPKSPLQLDISLAYVGRSSLNILTELHCTHHAAGSMAQCVVQSVCVDKESRRPSAFPDWWVARYKHLVEGQPLKSAPLEPPGPGKMALQSIAIDPIGADPYFHANWTSYLMMCHKARLTGLLSKGDVTSDALHAPVKSATLSYWKEGNLRDEQTVMMWPDELMQKVDHFQFVKDSSRDLVCQASVEFFEQQELPSVLNPRAKV